MTLKFLSEPDSVTRALLGRLVSQLADSVCEPSCIRAGGGFILDGKEFKVTVEMALVQCAREQDEPC